MVRAAQLAKLAGASLVIVSAHSPEPVPADLAGSIGTNTQVEAALSGAKRLAESEGVTVTLRSELGDPADAIIAAAESVGADLIVVGNKGMQRQIFGSVPNSVAHRASCDVLIIHTT